MPVEPVEKKSGKVFRSLLLDGVHVIARYLCNTYAPFAENGKGLA